MRQRRKDISYGFMILVAGGLLVVGLLDVFVFGDREPQLAVRGNLSKEAVQEVVTRNMGDVKSCYEAERARHPRLAGRLIAELTIEASGQVTASKVRSSPLGEAVESCVAQAVRSWQFPKPEGGGIAIVYYPFVFAPTGS